MPRANGKVSDIDSCGLTFSELQELWLGPDPTTGSCFCTREELVAAWAAGSAVVMRLWGSHGRRPQAWWAFETDLPYPGYYRERSTLWRAGVLGSEERTELEAEWRRDFDAARGMSARERREHYEHCDVPEKLIEAWTARRRRAQGPKVRTQVRTGAASTAESTAESEKAQEKAPNQGEAQNLPEQSNPTAAALE